MTKLLEQAVEAARGLPANTQDDIARVVLLLAGEDANLTIPLLPGEREAIEGSLGAARRGEFASDDDVRAAWAKHGL